MPVNNIVIIYLGNESSTNKVVIPTDLANNRVGSGVITTGRISMIVEMKLIASRIDDIPAKSKR